jgi:hypothetical protein
MSKSNNAEGGFTGKVGGTVIYKSNGQWVKRSVGKNTKPPTSAQLACREKVRLVTQLLKPVKEYISIGFTPTAKMKGLTYYNLASRYNLNNAIMGTYPDLTIDFTKVSFSNGTIPPTPGCRAELTDKGIRFGWDQMENTKLIRWNDQVMVMAYLPDEKDARYHICAGIRSQGEAFLNLPKYEHPVVVETYLTFLSASQKIISNCAYTGQLMWSAKY